MAIHFGMVVTDIDHIQWFMTWIASDPQLEILSLKSSSTFNSQTAVAKLHLNVTIDYHI